MVISITIPHFLTASLASNYPREPEIISLKTKQNMSCLEHFLVFSTHCLNIYVYKNLCTHSKCHIKYVICQKLNAKYDTHCMTHFVWHTLYETHYMTHIVRHTLFDTKNNATQTTLVRNNCTVNDVTRALISSHILLWTQSYAFNCHTEYKVHWHYYYCCNNMKYISCYNAAFC